MWFLHSICEAKDKRPHSLLASHADIVPCSSFQKFILQHTYMRAVTQDNGEGAPKNGMYKDTFEDRLYACFPHAW